MNTKLLMKKVFFLVAVSASIAATTRNGLALHTTKPTTDTTPVYEMKQYWLVLLYSGSVRSQDTATAARIQQAHMNNIDRLAAEGKIIMAGPMGGKTSLRGIFIMNGKDSAEVASHIKTDSAIVTGRLRFEIHPWWTAKGEYEFK